MDYLICDGFSKYSEVKGAFRKLKRLGFDVSRNASFIFIKYTESRIDELNNLIRIGVSKTAKFAKEEKYDLHSFLDTQNI